MSKSGLGKNWDKWLDEIAERERHNKEIIRAAQEQAKRWEQEENEDDKKENKDIT